MPSETEFFDPPDPAGTPVALLAIAATGVVVALVCLCLAAWFPANEGPDVRAIEAMFVVSAGLFQPESLERARYMAALVTAPGLLWGFQGLLLRHGPRRWSAGWWAIAQLLGALALVGVMGLDLRADGFYANLSFARPHPVLTALFALAAGFAAWHEPRWAHTRWAPWAIGGVPAGVAGLILANSRFGLPMVDELGSFCDSFEAFFYALAQVHYGRVLLVDLPSQYGLYPHFLAPWFKLVGLSLDSLSLTMSALILVSFGAIYAFMRRVIASPVLCSLAFLALFFYQYLLYRTFVASEFYFQYNPLRLLFPALLPLACWRYFAPWRDGRSRWSAYAGLWLGASLAVLWNVDTGAVVFGAWWLLLAYEEAFRPDRMGALRAVAGHTLAAGASLGGTFLAYTAVIRVVYGVTPDFGAFLAYQKLFVGSGYFMLPMPLLEWWNVLVLVYAGGLAIATQALWRAGAATQRQRAIWLVSVLGLGTFSYYQGRSHPLNFLFVTWPAFVLVGLFADGWLARLRALHADGRPRWQLLGLALNVGLVLAVLSAGALAVGARIPSSLRFARARAAEAHRAPATPVEQNLAFIRANRQEAGRNLILSDNAGVYYMGGGFGCPLQMPSSRALVLKRDYRRLAEAFRAQSLDRVFVDFTYIEGAPVAAMLGLVRELDRNYQVAKLSPTGTLALYVRRPRALALPLPGARLQPQREPDRVFWARFDPARRVLLPGSDAAGGFGSYVRAAPVTLGRAFTLELELRPAAHAASNGDVLASQHEPTSLEGFAFRHLTGDAFVFSYGNGRRLVEAPALHLPAGVWSRVTLVVRPEQIVLYRNGLRVAIGPAAGPLANSAWPLIVGGRQPFAGDVASVGLVNRPLSPLEVRRRSRRRGAPDAMAR